MKLAIQLRISRLVEVFTEREQKIAHREWLRKADRQVTFLAMFMRSLPTPQIPKRLETRDLITLDIIFDAV